MVSLRCCQWRGVASCLQPVSLTTPAREHRFSLLPSRVHANRQRDRAIRGERQPQTQLKRISGVEEEKK